MEYMFSLFGSEDWYDMSNEDWAADMARHAAFAAAVEEAGARIVAGAALQHSSTAAVSDNRRADAPTVTDGPFVETKEALGGFYVIDVRDREQALALAAVCPVGRVEVRPVLDTSQPPG